MGEGEEGMSMAPRLKIGFGGPQGLLLARDERGGSRIRRTSTSPERAVE